MCYPKPGPRCSAHAAAALTRAKHAKLNSMQPAGLDMDASLEWRNTMAAKLQEAQNNYDATPAGIKELQRRVRRGNGQVDTEMLLRLKAGIALREQQLAAIKAVDKGDIQHATQKKSHSYGERVPDSSPRPRHGISNQDPRIQTLIEDSQEWTNTLTPDEIEAVSWMTSNGSSEVNRYLTKTRDEYSPYSQGHLRRAVENLDSAFSKWERDEPVLVYRGISTDIVEASLNHDMYATGREESKQEYLDKHFAPGSVYESPVYMSTTIDPSLAADTFATSNIVMEIVSKKAAPVANVSAWATTEREMLLPRKGRYQVVKVLHNTPIVSVKSGKARECTVVQMIELD